MEKAAAFFMVALAVGILVLIGLAAFVVITQGVC